jgi:Protein of unknown function (DUF3307)
MIAILLCLHFVADFLLQTREMGKKKSEDFDVLVQHVIIQFFVVYLGGVFFMDPSVALRLSLLNMIIHGVIDWNIWRGYKLVIHKRLVKESEAEFKAKKTTSEKLYARKVKGFKFWEDHLFYTTIGFDQLLHALTLIGLYSVLS